MIFGGAANLLSSFVPFGVNALACLGLQLCMTGTLGL